jgi:fructan beta-fructosidase
MVIMKKLLIAILLLAGFQAFSQSLERTFKVEKRYINIPIENSLERQRVQFKVDGQVHTYNDIRIAKERVDYWTFVDVSAYKGKTFSLEFSELVPGIKKIYQSDEIAGADSLYLETNRPQIHFSTRRGWNNDANGLVWHDGEYHLFYQHNPYDINWGNMHWGHAVSTDLLHWEELPDVLHPDEHGTMFSGSALVDYRNTSGFQTGEEKVIVAAYTANHWPEREVQCIAYSNDRARTFTKFDGNPVIESKERWNSIETRDPKVFWHEESEKWVMVLFEQDGHSIYNSDDLKSWSYQSHNGGFWECPELFELAVDGNPNHKKWVMYGVMGTYMIGRFDGQKFIPETGKLRYYEGRMAAAQTFNNIPASDGRCIQIGWGRITHPGMPFNQMMAFPTQLTLRSTRNGTRLFSEPVREIAGLHQKSHQWSNLGLEEANEVLKAVEGDLFHIKMKVEITNRFDFRFLKGGNTIASYTFNDNQLNGRFYEGDNVEDMTIWLELLIDRTSVEIFADHGKFSLIEQLPEPENDKGFEFRANGFMGEILIRQLEVHELKSIWNP